MGGALTAVVVAAVIGGLFVVGPPSEERLRRQDAERIRNLSYITFAIGAHFTRTGNLPSSISQLDNNIDGSFPLKDPFTGAPYEYRAVDSTTYELCAVFAAEPHRPEHMNYDQSWQHGAGRTCFIRVARKER